MALTASLILSATDSSDQFFGGATYGKYQTAPVSLSGGRLYFLCFEARARFGTGTLGPDPTQPGANWDFVDWIRYDTVIGNGNDALYIWRCQPASNVASSVITIPTPGAYDAFQLWGHGQWHLIEFNGVGDESATNGAGLIGRVDTLTNGSPATSISKAFAVPFADAGSGSFALVGTSGSGGTITPAAGYTELGETSILTDQMESAFAIATSPFGGSWSASVPAGTIGVEILDLGAPPSTAGWHVGYVGLNA